LDTKRLDPAGGVLIAFGKPVISRHMSKDPRLDKFKLVFIYQLIRISYLLAFWNRVTT
jgi:hypothetical protein